VEGTGGWGQGRDQDGKEQQWWIQWVHKSDIALHWEDLADLEEGTLDQKIDQIEALREAHQDEMPRTMPDGKDGESLPPPKSRSTVVEAERGIDEELTPQQMKHLQKKKRKVISAHILLQPNVTAALNLQLYLPLPCAEPRQLLGWLPHRCCPGTTQGQVDRGATLANHEH
jgi:hypothetical protein